MPAGTTRGAAKTSLPLDKWGKGKDKSDGAHDGPARVVKPGDWNAVPDGSMKGFPLASFSMPGRTPPKPDPVEQKLASMAKDARKADEANKRALEKAAKDAEEAARASFARGREEGVTEGERSAMARYEQTLETLRNNTRGVLDAIAREKSTLFLEFEGQVLELVSGCIHRVFDGLAEEHAEAVLPLLKKAVASIGEAASVTIKVHPDNFKVVDENRPFWLSVNAGLKDIRVVTDDRINKGGCFVESDSTSVGAHAQEMADRIDEELKKVFMAKLQALRGPGAAVEGNAGDTSVSGHPADDPGEDPGPDAGGSVR
jgi:flagellar assembly protein FliH